MDKAVQQQDLNRWMAAYVVVTRPDGTHWHPESEPYAIVLDTGTHVWIASDYHNNHADHDYTDREVVRVGDGRSGHYDCDGNCIHSVPAEWCKFLSEDEAVAMMEARDADETLLGYAIG